MKLCPYCAENIQDDAVKCRFCGEFLDQSRSVLPTHVEPTSDEQRKWAEVRRLQRIASGPPPRADTMRKAKGLLALGMIIGILFYAYTWKKKHAETNPVQITAASITFEELNAMCGPASPLPASARRDIFDKHRGKRVTWEGKLVYINRGQGNELFITLINRASIEAAGIQLNFSETNRPQLADLRLGQMITYSGKITSYDENAQFFTLAHGNILETERL